MSEQMSSAKLNAAYINYGTPILEVLVEASIEELDFLEIEAIEIFNSVGEGFNTQKIPGGGNFLEGELSGASRFLDAQIEEVFKLLALAPELTHENIAEKTVVSKATVDAISGLKVHRRLHTKFPDLYKILTDRTNVSKFGKNKTLKDLNNKYPPLISPEGIEYIIENCSQFSKEHGLNNAHVIQVLKGKEKQHKGWRIKSEC